MPQAMTIRGTDSLLRELVCGDEALVSTAVELKQILHLRSASGHSFTWHDSVEWLVAFITSLCLSLSLRFCPCLFVRVHYVCLQCRTGHLVVCARNVVFFLLFLVPTTKTTYISCLFLFFVVLYFCHHHYYHYFIIITLCIFIFFVYFLRLPCFCHHYRHRRHFHRHRRFRIRNIIFSCYVSGYVFAFFFLFYFSVFKITIIIIITIVIFRCRCT